MLIHLPIIILTSLHPRLSRMPCEIRYRAECQFEAGSKEELDRCVADETQARKQLQTEWAQFAPSAKTQCNQENDVDGISSYVELQVCLEMERDVRKEVDGKM
jgi:hypothetical protein